jgi:hypothetical protein
MLRQKQLWEDEKKSYDAIVETLQRVSRLLVDAHLLICPKDRTREVMSVNSQLQDHFDAQVMLRRVGEVRIMHLLLHYLTHLQALATIGKELECSICLEHIADPRVYVYITSPKHCLINYQTLLWAYSVRIVLSHKNLSLLRNASPGKGNPLYLAEYH